MIPRVKLLSIILSLLIINVQLHAQSATFIALDNAGNLYEVNTGTCKSTKLTLCTNFTGNPLSIAMDGSTLYIVDNKGWLYKNTLTATGTIGSCTKLGQFNSKSGAIYGLTVGAGGKVYAASGSLIETYTPKTPTTGTFASLGSIPSTWTIGGDLLFYKGELYEAVNVGGSTTNNALIKVDTLKPAKSSLYMTFNAGVKVFGFASVTVPCANNQAYAVSTGTNSTEIFAVDMTNKSQSTTATCTLNYLVNDAASIAETQSATPPSSPTIVSPVNFCQNDPVTPLSATTNSTLDTLRWYTSSVGGVSTGSPVPTVSSSTLGTVKYYVSNFDTATKCESSRDSIIVSVNPYPAVPAISFIGSDTICVGSSILLTSSASSGNQWYFNNAIISGANTITNSVNTAGNYTVKTITTAGCSKTSTPTTITLTNASISYLGSPFCPSGTKAVTLTGDIGGKFSVAPLGLIIDSITGTLSLSLSKSGTYTVSYTVGPSACIFTTTVTIQAQAAGISYAKSSFCKSATSQPVIFSPGSVTNGTFSASPSGLSINTVGTIDPSTSSIGSYQVTYTYGTAGVGCGIMTTTDSVTITDVPTVPIITGLNKLCTGAGTTLINTSTGGLWSSSNTALATVISTTGAVTAVAQGTVNIIYSVTNACGTATQSMAITITNGPVTPPITGGNAVCIGSTIALSNTTAGGTWSSSNLSVATVNNNGVVTGIVAGSIIITYSVTTTCGIDNKTQAVTVNSPSVSTTAISICPTSLPYIWNGISYVAAGTYLEHLTNALGCDSAASLILSLKAPTTSSTTISICSAALPYSWNGNSYAVAGTYLVHLINAAGCDSASTLNLSLKLPTVSSTSVNICQAALPYLWNGNNYAAAGTYTIHLTNAAGCDSTATLILSVNAPSVSSTAISICQSSLPYSWNGNSYNVAGNYTVHLTSSVGCDSAATLILSVNNTTISNTAVNICQSALPYSWNGNTYAVAGNYTVHLTNALGCDSAATLVLSLITPSTSSTSVNICKSSLPYSWNGNTYNVAGTYIVHLINYGGCDSAASLVLSISLPPTNFAIKGGKKLCTSDVTLFTNTNANGTWSSSNTALATIDQLGYVKAITTGVDTITYTVSNFCGTVIDTFPVIIYPTPISTFITNPLIPDVCIGNPVLFSDNTTGSTVVKSIWYLGDNTVDTSYSLSYTYPYATTYNVTHRIIDQNGCISSPSGILVNVQNLPIVNNGATEYVLQYDSVTFNPQVLGIDNNYSVTWYPDIYLNNNFMLNPVCTPQNDITYTLTVKNAIGCSASDTLHVVVLKSNSIPNVFSPNGDGTHDFWDIKELYKFPSVILKVFDRNGHVIYSCNDKFKPWDGKYNGQDIPVGVYYYTIDRGFKLPILSGSLTVLR